MQLAQKEDVELFAKAIMCIAENMINDGGLTTEEESQYRLEIQAGHEILAALAKIK